MPLRPLLMVHVFNRLDHVLRACWREATVGAKQWANPALIESHASDEYAGENFEMYFMALALCKIKTGHFASYSPERLDSSKDIGSLLTHKLPNVHATETAVSTLRIRLPRLSIEAPA